MIRPLVNFSLKNPLLVLGLAVLMFVWGGVSFHKLPVDAYPDVANNYVNVITQWPRTSRSRLPFLPRSRWRESRTWRACAPLRWPAFPAS